MTKVVAVFLVALVAAAADVRSQTAPARTDAAREGPPGPVRFSAIDVFVDSGGEALAAYQFELKVTGGDVTLVGVEGGEHRAFRSPPHYDPKALAGQRIVIAAFDTGTDLPRGRTRVARLMVRVSGGVTPAYDATLSVAGSAEAKPIAATISVADAPGSRGDER